MVQPTVVRDAIERLASSGLGIGNTVNNPLDATLDDCAGTHEARFEGDVKAAMKQPPVVRRSPRESHRESFRVSGRVFERFLQVEGLRNQTSVSNNHRPDGNFSPLERLACLRKRKSHGPDVDFFRVFGH